MKKDLKIQNGISTMVRIILFFAILVSFSCRKSTLGEYSVMEGPFRQTITQTGELVAVNASYVTMPRINYVYGFNFKLIGLQEHGKHVQKGDSVVKIDPSSIHKYIIEKEESRENEIAASNKQIVQMENNLQDRRAQLKNEQASYDLKKLELERFSFESESKRRVKELEFKQAELRLAKVKRSMVLRPKLDSLDYRIQKIKVMQRDIEVKSAKETLKLLLIRSPGDGIFQIGDNMRTGQTIRVGDDVYIGSMIARIPDIKWMKVMTFVNETDITKVAPGMKVVIRLDALPSVPFNGVVTEISKICTDREKEKVFKVQVKVTESDLRLKPGMTVSCEYVCHESSDARFVPNKCLYSDEMHSYLFFKKGKSIKKVEVERGPSNSYYTIVKGDLRPGQTLELPENIINNIKN